ncbi:MAG TPA: glycoside hydrolase family 99-like domain-containing protein [bacterium]
MGNGNAAPPICILGMHGSGTDMVAQLLRAGGVCLGADDDLKPADAGDRGADGLWEHRGFTRLNDRLLAIAAGEGEEAPALEPGWSGGAAFDELRQEARELAATFAAGAPWAWKDPRTAFTHEFWRSVLPGARFVLCLRNPAELVLEPGGDREPQRQGRIWSAWEDYHRLLTEAPDPPAFHVVHCGSIFYDPVAEFSRLLGLLDLPVPEDAPKQAAAVVSGYWYRVPIAADVTPELQVPRAVAARHEGLCAAAGEVYERMLADETYQARLRRRGFASLFADFLDERQRHDELGGQHEDLACRHDAAVRQLRLLMGARPRRHRMIEQRLSGFSHLLGGLVGRGSGSTTPSPLARRFWALRRWRELLGLFNELWYLKEYPEVAEAGTDALGHFLTAGVLEGRRPNPFFDPEWYRQEYPASEGTDPLADYLDGGWRAGRSPGPLFDAPWYLAQNPDVARAGVEPLGHYLQMGWRENRSPSARFSIEQYLQAYPDVAKLGIEPITYESLHPGAGRGHGGEGMIRAGVIEEEIRASFANPQDSPDYEREEIARIDEPAVDLVAFYLPQFHPIAENDAHWGRGFTEWTNVSRARPMFRGHYQPHLPGELGFYDLRLPEVMQRQVELAKQHGIQGFCFYRYWFNGRTVLEQPLEQFLARPELDLKFCLCWANENWTRRWDGREEEVLLCQEHTEEDDEAFIADALRFFQDPRYIRIDEKPLLIVYHTQKMPEPGRTAARWRAFCARHGLAGVYLVAAQTCGFSDPNPIGFDAAVQFPPHNASVENLAPLLDTYGPFFGQIHEYAALAEVNTVQTKQYPLFNTVAVAWDNTARRGPAARVFFRATPAEYRRWLDKVLDLTVKHHPRGRRYAFINAWNEWAEGTHLEPDRKFGYTYLNETSRALLALAQRLGHRAGR